MYKIASVSPDSRKQVQQIMNLVYRENPEYWPYGLAIEGHDDVFLVRESASAAPVGFVGWQARYEPDPERPGRIIRVGYYTIGILPAYRKRGFAREAVQKIIDFKRGSYDKVQAFIVPENQPSRLLASKLRIPVVAET